MKKCGDFHVTIETSKGSHDPACACFQLATNSPKACYFPQEGTLLTPTRISFCVWPFSKHSSASSACSSCHEMMHRGRATSWNFGTKARLCTQLARMPWSH